MSVLFPGMSPHLGHDPITKSKQVFPYKCEMPPTPPRTMGSWTEPVGAPVTDLTG